jgi:hypothetical protein
MKPIYAALIAAFFTSSVQAQDVYKEMVLKTEVGQIVLTLEPCQMSPHFGYEYKAYATENGAPDHPGCWKEEGGAVGIWFPEIKSVATYKKSLFEPRYGI